MKSWSITLADLDRIALGTGVLGTGGGGDPYIGWLQAREQLNMGREIKVILPQDLDGDVPILPVGSIGAPTVVNERIDGGDEGARVVRSVEQVTQRKVGALVADEIGGANGIAPLILGAQLGLPVVDCDGMGRAFPEVQMSSFFINGQPTAPVAITDASGNVLVATEATSPEALENLMRAITVAMGCSAYMATPPMSAKFVARHAIPFSISRAWRIGDTILRARDEKADPVGQVASAEGGKVLISGKVTDVIRGTEAGFSKGQFTLTGMDQDKDCEMIIDIQNEFIIARERDAIVASVPDLICLLDSESGNPVSTEELRYGLRVSLLVIPAPEQLRTASALKVVGPRAFGYDFDFKPDLKPAPPRRADRYA